MQGLNKIFLLGRLGNDPQLYSTRNGKQFAALSIATTRYTSTNEEPNESKDNTDWHFVKVWGKSAENCTKYLTKGQAVMIEGYLTHYTQVGEDGKQGEKKTGINALKVEFLPRTNPLPTTAQALS
jgi:single-strand DNA-binding protein